jgi:hypothetical protein
MVVMDFYFVVGQVNCDVIHVQEIIGEKLLEGIALVAKTDNEIVDAIMAIDFHNVPNDRFATHFNQWFWRCFVNSLSLVREAPRQYHGLHLKFFLVSVSGKNRSW